MSNSIGDPRSLEDVKRQFHTKDGELKDKLSIDNSIAAHIRWRKQYKISCKGRLVMLNSCPTTEAIEYLRVEWKKYEMKCRASRHNKARGSFQKENIRRKRLRS